MSGHYPMRCEWYLIKPKRQCDRTATKVKGTHHLCRQHYQMATKGTPVAELERGGK